MADSVQNQPEAPTATKRRRRVSVGKLLLLALAVVVLAAGVTAYIILSSIGEMFRDCYDQWAVADIIIEHLDRNNGSWPKSWEDLREAYEICAGRHNVSRLDELRKRVGVRFDADPAELVKARGSGDQPPFRVIYLQNGQQHYIGGHEPNAMLLQYLRERAARPKDYKYPQRPDLREKEARTALTELNAYWQLGDNGRITVVRMQRPELTDAATVHLKNLDDLEELDLGYSGVTDAGLASIEDLPKLRSLDLYGTKVTDAGLRRLRHTSQMECLVLSPLNTDASLECVAKMTSLKTLNLNGTKVTDKGLVHLYGLRNLREVMLYNTSVTDEGARKLRQSLPDCKVEK
jgi:hypothetical protein